MDKKTVARQFKGVWIPVEIYLSDSISAMEKLVLTEINSLDGPIDHCYASNAHFSKFFCISTRHITKILASLVDKKWISIQMIGRNKRVILIEPQFHQRWNPSSITDRTAVPPPPKNNNEKDNKTTAAGAAEGEMIDMFKSVDPNFTRLFKRRNQREALRRLVKAHGEEKIEAIIAFLPRNNATPYAPKITSPIELENNMGRMAAFWKQKKNKGQINKNSVAIIL